MKPTRLMMARRHRAETGHRNRPVAGSHTSFQIKQGTQPKDVHPMEYVIGLGNYSITGMPISYKIVKHTRQDVA